MRHKDDDASARPGGDVLSFMRTAATTVPDREPPRQAPSSLLPILGALSDTRATVDLVLLAAETLEPHAARSFGAVLELMRRQLAATLATLQAHAATMEA